MVNLSLAARAVAQFPRDLARAHRGHASSPTTYLLARRAHVITSGRSTTALTTSMRAMPGSAEIADPEHLRLVRDRWASQAQELATDGACHVPDAFTADEIDALVDFATTGPARLTHADGSTSIGTYRDRPADVVSVRLDQSFLLTRPAVQAMLARGMAAQIATARSQMWATVHPPILYWSCRTATKPDAAIEQRLARRYHSDFDGLGGLRLHVYLTDVDSTSAPMDYVRTSHRPGAIPRSLRRDVTDDIADADVRRLFPAASLQTFTGPAGTSFMTDSNGLHRGNSPESADRLFLVMPTQAGSLAGAYNRVRRIPVVDDELAMALRCRRPDLRLFVAAPTGGPKVAVFAP